MQSFVGYNHRGEEAMLNGFLLLPLALLLALSAAHAPAPTWWATAVALLRRFATVSPPLPAALREAVHVPGEGSSSAIGRAAGPTQPGGAVAPETTTMRVASVVAPLAVLALGFAPRAVAN